MFSPSCRHARTFEVLKQPDGSKAFHIRINTNTYSLSKEKFQWITLIEYVRHLLPPHKEERYYSTTEPAVLAAVWDLKKFRGHVENQETIIASEHRPLNWLMNIKSPSGCLAK
ncbi:retrovirus-related Pol polyprotein from transposon 17.6 [Nephila pilipes]|uniref:Retrovirus-related Pol polyprotein from transposon 17.6 n=1 Tax=Nephila pilipes TaxID=299642 RepID=A0A8X6TE00_NEPPI|nr:retrovirus-related Pol polyprotein from transposon 17.6 [Nephila pilipes]